MKLQVKNSNSHPPPFKACLWNSFLRLDHISRKLGALTKGRKPHSDNAPFLGSWGS